MSGQTSPTLCHVTVVAWRGGALAAMAACRGPAAEQCEGQTVRGLVPCLWGLCMLLCLAWGMGVPQR